MCSWGNVYFLFISIVMYLGETTPLYVGTIRAFSTLGLLVSWHVKWQVMASSKSITSSKMAVKKCCTSMIFGWLMTIFPIRKSPFWACWNFWTTESPGRKPLETHDSSSTCGFSVHQNGTKSWSQSKGIQRRGTLNPLHNELRARDKPGISPWIELPQAYQARGAVRLS